MTSLHPVERIRAIRTHASDHSMPTMWRHLELARPRGRGQATEVSEMRDSVRRVGRRTRAPCRRFPGLTDAAPTSFDMDKRPPSRDDLPSRNVRRRLARHVRLAAGERQRRRARRGGLGPGDRRRGRPLQGSRAVETAAHGRRSTSQGAPVHPLRRRRTPGHVDLPDLRHRPRDRHARRSRGRPGPTAAAPILKGPRSTSRSSAASAVPPASS